jgi:carbon monoxide dehydrogenase subunit G
VRVEGTRSFAAPRRTVWDILNSPERMAELMPGVESFDVQDERHWRANVKIPLGLGGLRMAINFEKLEERELEFARLSAKGTGVGALMNMETSFDLGEEGEGTAMRWAADVKIAGPVGSMGQRVLQPIVNQQVQQVLNALDRQVMAASGGGGAEASGRAEDAGPPAESTPGADASEVEGSSGAEEGIHEASPETYTPDPEGPTHSTQD